MEPIGPVCKWIKVIRFMWAKDAPIACFGTGNATSQNGDSDQQVGVRQIVLYIFLIFRWFDVYHTVADKGKHAAT